MADIVQNVIVNFEVDYTELDAALGTLGKAGKVDTKGFDAIQNAIDTTATDSKGLIKTFKEVATASTKMGKTVEDAFGAGVQDALDNAGVSVEEFAAALKKSNAPATTLRKELAQLKDQMAKLKAENKDTGKTFDDLKNRAGKLADAISDANAEIKNAGSDTRGLDNVVGSISALAGGYAAVQGAVALFGEENEDLQKTLVKVNGAMALAQGLQIVYNATLKEGALTKLADSVATGAQTAATTLYTFVMGGATVATKALRAALIATGIGAIVVLVLSLVSALDLFGGSAEKAAEAQKKLKEEFEGTNNAIDSLITNLGNIRNQELAIAKLQGKSLAEQFKINQAFRESEIKSLRAKVRIAYDFFTQQEELYEDEKATLDDISAARAEYAKAQQNLNNALSASNVERFNEELRVNEASKKAIEDAIKKREEQRKKIEEAIKKATAAELAELDKRVKAQLAALNKEEEQSRIHFENEQDILEQARQQEADINKKWDDLRLQQMDFLARSSQIAADKAKADRDAEDAKIEQRRARIISIAQELGGVFAELSRQQSARDQAFVDGKRREIEELARAGALSAKQAEARQKQLDDLERRQKNKAAQRDKQFAVFQALLAVPQAYLTGLKTSLPLAIIMGALAAVQAALVISRPVPKFFKGKKDSYEGPGEVADMGAELVERGGRMFLYTKPTQTYLGAQDKVYTAAETRQIMHNTNVNTTIHKQTQPGFDYSKFAAAIPKGAVNINIDKDFISESVASGLQRTNYMDRRYSSK